VGVSACIIREREEAELQVLYCIINSKKINAGMEAIAKMSK
jgi:hypothetical protein